MADPFGNSRAGRLGQATPVAKTGGGNGTVRRQSFGGLPSDAAADAKGSFFGTRSSSLADLVARSEEERSLQDHSRGKGLVKGGVRRAGSAEQTLESPDSVCETEEEEPDTPDSVADAEQIAGGRKSQASPGFGSASGQTRQSSKSHSSPEFGLASEQTNQHNTSPPSPEFRPLSEQTNHLSKSPSSPEFGTLSEHAGEQRMSPPSPEFGPLSEHTDEQGKSPPSPDFDSASEQMSEPGKSPATPGFGPLPGETASPTFGQKGFEDEKKPVSPQFGTLIVEVGKEAASKEPADLSKFGIRSDYIKVESPQEEAPSTQPGLRRRHETDEHDIDRNSEDTNVASDDNLSLAPVSTGGNVGNQLRRASKHQRSRNSIADLVSLQGLESKQGGTLTDELRGDGSEPEEIHGSGLGTPSSADTPEFGEPVASAARRSLGAGLYSPDDDDFTNSKSCSSPGVESHSSDISVDSPRSPRRHDGEKHESPAKSQMLPDLQTDKHGEELMKRDKMLNWYHEELLATQDELDEAQHEIRQQQNELDEARQEIRQQAKNDILYQREHDAGKEPVGLPERAQKQLSAARAECTALEAELADRQERLDGCYQRLMQARVQDLSRDSQTTNKDAQSGKGEDRRLHDEAAMNKTLRLENDDLASEVRALQAQLANRQRMQQSLSDEEQFASAEAAAARIARQQVATLGDALERAESEVMKVSALAGSPGSPGSPAHSAIMHHQLQHTKSDAFKLEQECTALTAALRDEEERADTAAAEVSEALAVVAASQEQIDEVRKFEGHVADEFKVLADTRSDLADTRKQLAAAQTEASEAEETAYNLKKGLDAARTARGELQGQLIKAEEKNTHLELQLRMSEVTAEGTAGTKLEEEVHSRKQAERRLSLLEISADDLNSQLSSEHTSCKTAEARFRKAEQQVQFLDSEQKAVLGQASEAQSKLEASQQLVHEMKTEVESETASKIALGTSLSKSQQLAADLQTELHSEIASRKKTMARLSQLEESTEDMDSKLRFANASFRNAEARLASEEDSAESLRRSSLALGDSEASLESSRQFAAGLQKQLETELASQVQSSVKLFHAEESVEQLQARLEATVSLRSKAEARLEAAETIIADLQAAQSSLSMSDEEAAANLSRVASALVNSEASLEDTKQFADGLKEQLKTERESLMQADVKAFHMEESLQQLQARLDTALASRTDADSRLRSAEQTIAGLQQEVLASSSFREEESAASLRRSSLALADSEASLENSQQFAAGLQNQLEAEIESQRQARAKMLSMDETLEQLQARLDTAAASNREVKSRWQDAEKQIAALNQAVVSTSSANEESAARLHTSSLALADSEARLENAKQVATDLQVELETEIESQRRASAKSLGMNESLEQLQGRLDTAAASHQDVECRLQSAERTIEALNQAALFTSSVNEEESAASLRSSSLALAGSEASLETSQRFAAVLQEELEMETKSQRQASAKLLSMDESLQHLQARLDAAAASHQEVEYRWQAAENRIEELNQAVLSVSLVNEQSDATLRSTARSLADAEADLEICKQFGAGLQRQLEAKLASEMQASVKLFHAQESADMLQAQLDSAVASCTDAESRWQTAEQTIADLRQASQAATIEVVSLQETREELASVLQTRRAALQASERAQLARFGAQKEMKELQAAHALQRDRLLDEISAQRQEPTTDPTSSLRLKLASLEEEVADLRRRQATEDSKMAPASSAKDHPQQQQPGMLPLAATAGAVEPMEVRLARAESQAQVELFCAGRLREELEAAQVQEGQLRVETRSALQALDTREELAGVAHGATQFLTNVLGNALRGASANASIPSAAALVTAAQEPSHRSVSSPSFKTPLRRTQLTNSVEQGGVVVPSLPLSTANTASAASIGFASPAGSTAASASVLSRPTHAPVDAAGWPLPWGPPPAVAKDLPFLSGALPGPSGFA